MKVFLENATFFGAALTLAAFGIGVWIKQKTKVGVFNPILVGAVLVVLFLKGTGVEYDAYNIGAKYISFLLTPATVCLAIPLYEKFELLKKNWLAVVIGITSGVLTSLISVFVMALALGLKHEEYVTLLPKSITTAIGMGLSEEMGGIVSITVAAIIVTGVLGNMVAEASLKLFRITEPIAHGIAIGTSAHAVGTAKAMELGDTEGAMSSLSIVVSGLMTVVGASFFARFL